MSIKLSDTQHAALVEVSELGYTLARANTIKSLVEKELISPEGNTHHKLTTKGRAVLGLDNMEESVESGGETGTAGKPDLQGDGDEALFEDDVEIFKAMAEDISPETFTSELGVYSNTLMGFGDVYKWKNFQVWDGLTAQEIREDMDTALPIGRKARRERGRLVRKLTKSFELVGA